MKKIKFSNIKYFQPFVGFSSNTNVYGRPNSIQAFDQVMDFQPDVIEMDVRCSRDGVVYCYHGLEPFCRIWKFFKFSTIQKFTKADKLEDVLSVVSKKGKPIIFLDIKQGLMPIKLVDEVCAKFDFDYTWIFISYFSVRRAKKKLKDRDNYFFECFPFLNIYPFWLNFYLAKKSSVNIFNLSYNQFSQKNVDLINRSKMVHNIYDNYFGIFRMKKEKSKYLTKKYGRAYIFFYDLSDPEINSFWKNLDNQK